jgi:hypothetical protein
MEFDKQKYSSIYKELEANAKSTIISFFDASDITGTDKAQVISNIINNLVDKALLGMIELEKLDLQNEQLQKQIQEIDANISLKQKQELEVVASTSRENDLANAKILDLGASVSLKQKQELEVVASTSRENDLSSAKILDLGASVSLKGKQELEVVASTTRENSLSSARVNDLNKSIELKEEQRQEVSASTVRNDNLATADINLKDAEEKLREQQKTELVSNGIKDRTIKDRNADLLQEKLLLEQGLRPEKIESAQIDNNTKTHRLTTTIPLQDSKIEADIEYVDQQKTSLADSVEDNRNIKSLGSMGDTIGMITGASIVPPSGMVNSYLSVYNDLTGSVGGATDGFTKIE